MNKCGPFVSRPVKRSQARLPIHRRRKAQKVTTAKKKYSQRNFNIYFTPTTQGGPPKCLGNSLFCYFKVQLRYQSFDPPKEAFLFSRLGFAASVLRCSIFPRSISRRVVKLYSSFDKDKERTYFGKDVLSIFLSFIFKTMGENKFYTYNTYDKRLELILSS